MSAKEFTSAYARAVAESETNEPPPPVEFTMDRVVRDVDGKATIIKEPFQAAPIAPGDAIMHTAVIAESGTNGQRAMAIAQFLDVVLLPDSRTRMAAGLRDAESPLSAEDAGEVVKWMLEEVYGEGRPTGPSSPGSASASPGGDGSTDGAPPEA
jgi:hypothetical protein